MHAKYLADQRIGSGIIHICNKNKGNQTGQNYWVDSLILNHLTKRLYK